MNTSTLPSYAPGAAYAAAADAADPLRDFKSRFYFPQHAGSDAIYFCGNSLGLQPRQTEAAIQTELESWRQLGVGGYMQGTNPWLYYQDYCKPVLAKLTGASTDEVTVMNALTVNLHLLMLSFYKPEGKRFKIMMEAGAFPSDQYAVETQVRHYGYLPDEAIIEIAPREGEKTLRTEDITDAIHQHADSLALILFGGMNYYTGQLFDMEAITRAGHAAGSVVGFDLAHVVGNVPVQLHSWGVDFAAWCSYKYLNAGPGAVGGVFVHEKHGSNIHLHRMGGWWGNAEQTRFKMEKGFVPKPDASGWCLSTSQVFNTVCLKASLAMFDEAGMEAIRQKSVALTGYLEYLLHQNQRLQFEIITPSDPKWRGAQLSLYFPNQGRAIHDAMHQQGIVVDYREPGVIRVAPAPLYCSFADVHRFAEILENHLG